MQKDCLRIFIALSAILVSLLTAQSLVIAKQSPAERDASQTLDPARKQFLKAVDLHNQRQYPQATAAFESFMHDFPKNTLARDACVGRAICLRKGAQLEASSVAYQDCVLRYPSDPEVQFWQLEEAELLESLGRLQPAAEIYQEVLRKAPNNSEVTFLLGRVLRESQKLSAAKEVLKVFLESKQADDPFRFAGLLVLRAIIENDPKENELLQKIDTILNERLQKVLPSDGIFIVS